MASFLPPPNYRTHQNRTHPVTNMLQNPWWILSPHLSWHFSSTGYRGSLPPLKYNFTCLWRYHILLSFLLTLSAHSFSVFITSLSFVFWIISLRQEITGDFTGGPGLRILLPAQGTQVWFLVRELRALMLQGNQAHMLQRRPSTAISIFFFLSKKSKL